MDYRFYILALFVIGLSILGSFMGLMLSGAAIIILFMLFVFVKDAEKTVTQISKDKKRILQILESRLDSFSDKLDETKKDLSKQMFSLHSKVSAYQEEGGVEIENNFRELARKILQIENKLNDVKRKIEYEA